MIIEDPIDAQPFVRGAQVHYPEGMRDCAECRRLWEQARAAVLSHDLSRLSDVHVLQHRHDQANHTDQGAARVG